MVKYIIFDFDGTIVDSVALYLRLSNELASELKLQKFDMEDLRFMSSMPIKERCKKIGIPLYKLPALGLRVQEKVKHHIDELKWIQGIEDVIYRLKEQGLKLVIISSNSIYNINQFLKSKNFNAFEGVYSSKGLFDKYQVINKLIKKLNVEKDEVVYVGDEYRDILACKKSRIKIISVTWGFDSRELISSGNPDFIADTPDELLSQILKL